MDSRQRYEAAMRLEEPDRVPILNSGAWCANLIGVKMPELVSNGETWGKAQIAALRRFKYDCVLALSDTAIELQSFGAKTKIPEWHIPTAEPIVRSPEDLDGLEIPDPRRDGRLPAAIESVEFLRKEVGNEVYIIGGCNSPFTLAGGLMGVELMLISLIKNQDFVRKCLDITLEHTANWTKALIDAGADQVMTYDPIATGDLISLKHFKDFALPYAKKQSETLREYGGRYAHAYHICGDTTDRLSEISEIGGAIVSLDEKVDIGYAKEKIGRRICIAGNVKTGTLLMGDPQQVEVETRECIEKAAPGGGYVLCPGCDMPLNSPIENVERFVKVGKEYTYPLPIK